MVGMASMMRLPWLALVTGIAMGRDVAMETADVILVRNQLQSLSYLHRLAKKHDRIIWRKNIGLSC